MDQMKDQVETIPANTTKIGNLRDYALAEICMTLKEFVPEIEVPVAKQLQGL